MRTPLSRREFLATSTALLAGAAVSRAADTQKLRLAVIGCGGRGAGNLQAVLGEEVVALCDVNSRNLAAAAEHAPQARQFKDFRVLYDSLRDDEFDAVVVSTTEHTHAFATLPALRRKKHVYCEKPLTRDIYEARAVQQAAREAGVATQMGTQIHAENNYRRVVELIQARAIGQVTEAHVWVDRAWGWQSKEDAERFGDIVWTMDRPAESEPIPPELDWDLWLGPAPERPYHSVYFPGPKWYRWWDFANGTFSDLGSHWVDLPFWALGLEAPLTVEASGPPPHPEIAPASMTARYEYALSRDQRIVPVHWYQGTYKPELWTAGEIPQWGSGVLFIGTHGMLLSDYSRHLLLPEDQFSSYERPPETIPPSLGHHAEWLHACKTGEPTTCHFGYSGPLTEANHLGSVAYRAGTKIEWDAANLRIPNAPQAEQYLRREYRSGWEL